MTSNLLSVPALLENAVGSAPSRRYAGAIFPLFEALTARDAYKVAKFGGDNLKPEDFLRAMGKEPTRWLDLPKDTVEIPVSRYSIESSADWAETEGADNIIKKSMLLLESRAKFALEKLFNSIEAQQIISASNEDSYPEGHVLSPEKHWDDTSSDPIAQIEEAKGLIQSKIGFKPNRITISDSVWSKLRVRQNLLSKLPSTALKAGLTPEAFGEIVGIKNVVIADTIFMQDGRPVYAWGKDVQLCYNPDEITDPQYDPVFGITILRPLGYKDMRYYVDDMRTSDVFAADRYLGWGIVNPEAGFLFKSVIA